MNNAGLGFNHDAVDVDEADWDAMMDVNLKGLFFTTQAVGRHKATSGLPAADPGREERQIARLRQLAEEAELDPEFSEKFLRFIIDEVIRHHEQLRG